MEKIITWKNENENKYLKLLLKVMKELIKKKCGVSSFFFFFLKKRFL